MIYIHNTELVGPTHDFMLSSCWQAPSDQFISLSLLPGGFGERVPQAARLSLFPTLLFSDFEALFIIWGQSKSKRAKQEKVGRGG